MVNTDIILNRDSIVCIVDELLLMLKVESHYQFRLSFITNDKNERKLQITPHATPVDIVLEAGRY
jgi:hypothetical protein